MAHSGQQGISGTFWVGLLGKVASVIGTSALYLQSVSDSAGVTGEPEGSYPKGEKK